MSRRRAAPSLVASPVLVGAVTVLVSIIAVFIAYNANAGLPFVPTYDIKAELLSGNKLVRGNEVRVGGFRVGVVDALEPRVLERGSERRAVAVLSMKLDKTVEPLATDSQIRVRPRSALGLKYVELTPGKSRRTFAAGDTLPLRNAREGLELEDVFSTFDEDTRDNARETIEGFGDAFAGRGASLNAAIAALNPFFTSLDPVMRALSDPDTRLDQLFVQLGQTFAQVAPVARVQAELFSNIATTFAALSSSPEALRQTIEKSPPTIDTAVRSFVVLRPFLADLADLSHRLRPAVRELPRSLPAINRALAAGTLILPRTVELSNNLRGAFAELEDLFENPNTLLTIRDLDQTLTVARPALEYLAPYQTVCNFFNYFFHALGEHQSTTVPGGTVQTQGVKLANLLQPNTYADIEASRNWDVPPGVDPRGASLLGMPLGRSFGTPYQPAIDAQGNADCQNGQQGFPRGPWTPQGFRQGPGELSDGTPTGGNWPVIGNDYPILSGPTFKSQELGINSLQDMDKLR